MYVNVAFHGAEALILLGQQFRTLSLFKSVQPVNPAFRDVPRAHSVVRSWKICCDVLSTWR